MLTTLIDIGFSGVVALVLWLTIHYKTKAIVERLDKVESALEKHEGLGREFSELRGAILGWRGGRRDSPSFPYERWPPRSKEDAQ